MKDIELIEVMSLSNLVERANSQGIQISPYLVRQAIKNNQIPCRLIGHTYLIPWNRFLDWVSCTDGNDNQQVGKPKCRKSRKKSRKGKTYANN